MAIAGSESPDDRDWFDLAVTVSVDGEHVPFERLFVALSSGESHLILPSGTFFSLDRPEFGTLAELIAEARAMQDPGSDNIRLSRYQASLWEELDRLGVISGQAADWQRSVRALTRVAELAEPAIPQTLQAVLRPYQHTGFSWLAFLYANRLGGILADEMGLGKTLQTLALICHAKHNHDTDGPFLVVAPTSVVVNWAAECRRFAPELAVRVITENGVRVGELAACTGVTVRALKYYERVGLGRTVLYVYPLSGRPGVDLPEGWDTIPGARGCTAEACGLRDHHQDLCEAGVARVYGLSTQPSDYQRELVDRQRLPFASSPTRSWRCATRFGCRYSWPAE